MHVFCMYLKHCVNSLSNRKLKIYHRILKSINFNYITMQGRLFLRGGGVYVIPFSVCYVFFLGILDKTVIIVLHQIPSSCQGIPHWIAITS